MKKNWKTVSYNSLNFAPNISHLVESHINAVLVRNVWETSQRHLVDICDEFEADEDGLEELQ